MAAGVAPAATTREANAESSRPASLTQAEVSGGICNKQ